MPRGKPLTAHHPGSHRSDGVTRTLEDRLEAYPASPQFGAHAVLQNTGLRAAPTSSGLRTLVVCGAS